MLHTLEGRCELRWVKSSKNPSTKSPYKVHILTLEWKTCLKPMLSGPYVVINQLMKPI